MLTKNLADIVRRHLSLSQAKRAADFAQLLSAFRSSGDANALSEHQLSTLLVRFEAMVVKLASMTDPTAYVQLGNVLNSLQPGHTHYLVLPLDKERLEAALKAIAVLEQYEKLLSVIYGLLEAAAEHAQLHGLLWMIFASFHPNVEVSVAATFRGVGTVQELEALPAAPGADADDDLPPLESGAPKGVDAFTVPEAVMTNLTGAMAALLADT